jgi:hypothetical protein
MGRAAQRFRDDAVPAGSTRGVQEAPVQTDLHPEQPGVDVRRRGIGAQSVERRSRGMRRYRPAVIVCG